MRNRTGGPCRLEEAFRKELFRLINQYLSFPEDATLGTIGRTLVNFQQVSAVLEAYDSTLVIVDELCGKPPCSRRRDEVRARRKEEIKGLAARKKNRIL
jgi:hypothetical protein